MVQLECCDRMMPDEAKSRLVYALWREGCRRRFLLMVLQPSRPLLSVSGGGSWWPACADEMRWSLCCDWSGCIEF